MPAPRPRSAPRGPVANFFQPVGELRENEVRSTFWLYVWVLRRSKPYLWLSRGRFGRAQFARKPRVEKLCDRPRNRWVWKDRVLPPDIIAPLGSQSGSLPETMALCLLPGAHAVRAPALTRPEQGCERCFVRRWGLPSMAPERWRRWTSCRARSGRP